jgi:hypothetical protein
MAVQILVKNQDGLYRTPSRQPPIWERLNLGIRLCPIPSYGHRRSHRVPLAGWTALVVVCKEVGNAFSVSLPLEIIPSQVLIGYE